MKHKILIVDDDKEFAKNTKKSLKDEGLDVITASTGQEGFHKIRKLSPDLVFLNLMKRNSINGTDTARAVIADAAFSEIPVFLLADRGKQLDEHEKNLPVKGVIDKPAEPGQLLSVIRRHIQEKGKSRREMLDEIDGLIEMWREREGNLIMILHEIQNKYGYVPRGVSFELSRLLDIPMARIYEVLTFYNYFKTTPPGRHLISVCMGTACYLKGSGKLLSELKNLLNVEEGETSEDGIFQLQVVRCLGCCGLAPVVMIGEKVHGGVKPGELPDILSKYSSLNDNETEGA